MPARATAVHSSTDRTVQLPQEYDQYAEHPEHHHLAMREIDDRIPPNHGEPTPIMA
jgi:hypothetical protein